MNLKEEPESESKRNRSESPEFTSIYEHTDLSEEPSDHEHKNKSESKWVCELPKLKHEHVEITHLSKEPSDEDQNIRVRPERAPFPTLSLLSDSSVEPPADCKAEDTFPLDSRLLTEHHLRCSVCKSMLKDPVSISCGHSYCRGCISEYWDNCAEDYVCPQCGNQSETRPVLNTNAALAEVVKSMQKAGFSPALPPQSYAGPEDVACDICTEQKLKAVKCCLTCVMSLCETHVRQHYTIPALQKHTLSDVTGDMKTRTLQEHQNTDNSFTASGQQEQSDTTQDVIKEEKTEVSGDDTDVRSLESYGMDETYYREDHEYDYEYEYDYSENGFDAENYEADQWGYNYFYVESYFDRGGIYDDEGGIINYNDRL